LHVPEPAVNLPEVVEYALDQFVASGSHLFGNGERTVVRRLGSTRVTRLEQRHSEPVERLGTVTRLRQVDGQQRLPRQIGFPQRLGDAPLPDKRERIVDHLPQRSRRRGHGSRDRIRIIGHDALPRRT
jgi:hypothetical protein